MPAIEDGYAANFKTLMRAADSKQLALLDCRDKNTGKPVRVIVAVNKDGEAFEFVPLARMFDGNPYDELDPPDTESTDGYAEVV